MLLPYELSCISKRCACHKQEIGVQFGLPSRAYMSQSRGLIIFFFLDFDNDEGQLFQTLFIVFRDFDIDEDQLFLTVIILSIS